MMTNPDQVPVLGAWRGNDSETTPFMLGVIHFPHRHAIPCHASLRLWDSYPQALEGALSCCSFAYAMYCSKLSLCLYLVPYHRYDDGFAELGLSIATLTRCLIEFSVWNLR